MRPVIRWRRNRSRQPEKGQRLKEKPPEERKPENPGTVPPVFPSTNAPNFRHQTPARKGATLCTTVGPPLAPLNTARITPHARPHSYFDNGPRSHVTERPRRPAPSESSIFPMPIHWTILFRAALRQQDPAKLPKLVDQARRAINDRVLERGTKSADAQEKEELEEALRQITLLEQKRKSEPRAKSARPE